MQKSLLDVAWVVVASGLVFIMQAGFAMLESGLTRGKNSINVAIKNLTDLGISVICFWAVGYALMFGASRYGLFGTTGLGFSPSKFWPMAFFLFQVMFCSTSATIVSGAVAERMRYISYILSTVIMSALIYPVFGHWAWGGALEGSASGWLAKLGFVDFAGSSVVHSVGGWVSLAVLLVIGPRSGRYDEAGRPRPINGNNIPMAVLGVMILWFGWIGFNGGSTLSMNEAVAGIVVRTTLAAAAGMVASLAVGWPLLKRPDINLVINGSLAGLVAITANCHCVNELESILIGASGGLITLGCGWLLDRLRVDDAVGAIPVHLASGVWGTLCVGFFGHADLLATGLSRAQQIGVQALGVGVCGAWSFGVALLATLALNKISPIRVSREQEMEGLNKAEHGVSTEIYELFSVLDSQSKTGDLSQRAPVEPFTEVGQIAGMYNAVLDTLGRTTIEKGDYLSILESVSEGLFLLEADGRLGPYYSRSLEGILRQGSLASRSFAEILKPHLEPRLWDSLGDFLEVCFDPAYAWDQVEKLNPLREVELSLDSGQGGFDQVSLAFKFKRIEKDGRVVRLFVTVQDKSKELELARRMERNAAEGKSEMELLYRILQVDPAMLGEFLVGARQDADYINATLREGEGDYRQRLAEVFRHSHSLKGDSDLLGLDFLTDKAELMEKSINQTLAKEEIGSEDFLALTLAFAEVKKALDRMAKLSANLGDFAKPGAKSLLRDSLMALAGRLAARHGKAVELTVEGDGLEAFESLDPRRKKLIRDALVQLVRNAVYHGLESPERRLQAGKDERGRVAVRVERRVEGGKPSLFILVADDGQGLDLEAIRRKAVARGLVGQESSRALKPAELAQFIFTPLFSTAASDTSSAGKGIGLSLVQQNVKRAGARLSLSSSLSRGCEFRINLGLDLAS